MQNSQTLVIPAQAGIPFPRLRGGEPAVAGEGVLGWGQLISLFRVTAFASLSKHPVTHELAENVLKDLMPNDHASQITAATIMTQTAAYYALTIDDLCSVSRSRQLVTARQIAMYLCRELTELSLPKIGQHFGNRDHTTVMHADRKIRHLMAERRSVYNQVTELTNRIKSQTRS